MRHLNEEPSSKAAALNNSMHTEEFCEYDALSGNELEKHPDLDASARPCELNDGLAHRVHMSQSSPVTSRML